METLPGSGSAVDRPLESRSGTASQTAKTFEPLAPGFVLDSIRCAVECRLHERVAKDEDLLARIKALSEEREQSRVQTRLGLLTDGYRVDEAITPKLHRLGQLLTRILRLPQPLDLFIWSSEEKNAYCLSSRKGNRLIMCLYSGLVASLSSQELLFTMGHEVGHALLNHGQTLGVSFNNPDFSPIEVARLRTLDRSQEVSCDRFGLLACQDVHVASAALFKIASGLNERWITFDEHAYAGHFDVQADLAELVPLDDASRTHPLMPLRVKALVDFSKSATYFQAFRKTGWRMSSEELEQRVETMLSVLDPDLPDEGSVQEKEALEQFLIDGALLIIAADGIVEPGEVAWLQSMTEHEWSREQLSENLGKPEVRDEIWHRVEAQAHVLANQLPEAKRTALLRLMCDVALSAGGIPDEEFEVLDRLRQLLRIRTEFAQAALDEAKEEAGSKAGQDADKPGTSATERAGEPKPPSDPLEAILERAKLTEVAIAHCRQTCDQIRSQGLDLGVAVRTLLSWAVTASRRKGPLTQTQAKRLAVSAIKVCREFQDRNGVTRKNRGTPIDRQIQDSGIVALFQRGELVSLGPERKPMMVMSVSRAKGTLLVAVQDNLDATEQVEPSELTKDPIGGFWPDELGGG